MAPMVASMDSAYKLDSNAEEADDTEAKRGSAAGMKLRKIKY
jgi:polysaccharide pyruvyl transferase WcaK-like protein